MKQWVSKLIDQLNYELTTHEDPTKPTELSEDRATLLYFLDVLNKHLLEVEHHPVRKVRRDLDDFSKELLHLEPKKNERTLYRLREFLGRYRIDEYTYLLKTFNDFRSIIWDFVEQITEDLDEEVAESELQEHLSELREAVEANSIEQLRSKSMSFIDSYSEYQVKKDRRKSAKLKSVKKNLDNVKKQLVEANHNLLRDHLTGAFNRKSFDEKMQEHWQIGRITKSPLVLLALDIDHFKKINDTHGHAIGDFVLVETVKLLNQVFHRDKDFVARVGGEEFSIILPDYTEEAAIKKAEQLLKEAREAVFVQDDREIRFTVSVGIAIFDPKENIDQWMKRADEALYHSKNTGRNRLTLSGKEDEDSSAA